MLNDFKQISNNTFSTALVGHQGQNEEPEKSHLTSLDVQRGLQKNPFFFQEGIVFRGSLITLIKRACLLFTTTQLQHGVSCYAGFTQTNKPLKYMEAIVFQEFLMVSAISTAMNKKVLEGSYNIMFIRLPGKLLDYAVG